MRALVTGATGFIGSFLTSRLMRAGAEVAVLTRRTSNPWRIQEILPRLTRIEGDLRDLAAIEGRLAEFAPDTIFHLGWHGVTNACRNDPEQIDANLQSSLDLMRLAPRIGCSTWIGLGSQAEYGPANQLVAEDTPTRPTTTYGAVKLCVNLLTARMAAECKIRHAWLRVFSTYGPKDNPEWMIPYLIRSLLDRQKPSLTACEQKWDYLYVEDAAEAIYRTAITPSAEGVFNLGSGTAYPLRTVVEAIRDLVDPSLPLGIGEVAYRPDQVMHLQADITRLRQVTGWSATTDFRIGLEKTVKWFRDSPRT